MYVCCQFIQLLISIQGEREEIDRWMGRERERERAKVSESERAKVSEGATTNEQPEMSNHKSNHQS